MNAARFILRMTTLALMGVALLSAPALAEGTALEPTPTPNPTPQPRPTIEPTPTTIGVVQAPKVSGTIRYGKTLSRTGGTYTVTGLTHRNQWLRNGKPIKGATGWKHKLGVADVGKKLSVRVTVAKPGHQTTTVTSQATASVKHVRDVRKTVKYQITTKGTMTTSVPRFRKDVKNILNDPRGWRSSGIAFKEVKSGGNMTIVLANANQVTSYSNQCSSQWSCRVGGHVIINQERWKHATPTWQKAQGTTRAGYRHMVINHETGHWLGWGHHRCTGKGNKAPLMMQQSKGFRGCTANPWPTKSELRPPRFR